MRIVKCYVGALFFEVTVVDTGYAVVNVCVWGEVVIVSDPLKDMWTISSLLALCVCYYSLMIDIDEVQKERKVDEVDPADCGRGYPAQLTLSIQSQSRAQQPRGHEPSIYPYNLLHSLLS